MTGAPDPQQLLVSVPRAAELLGISGSLLYKKLQRHEIDIPILHIGRVARLRVADIERWVARQTEEGGS